MSSSRAPSRRSSRRCCPPASTAVRAPACSANTTRLRQWRAPSARSPPAGRPCFATPSMASRRTSASSSCSFRLASSARSSPRGSPGRVEVEKRAPGSDCPCTARARTLSGWPACSRWTHSRGGFVVQSFIAYWFRLKFGVSVEVLGLVFFGVGLLQAGSFMVATRLADRIGLLNTMVFTHLPSNLFLAAIPLAPTFPVAMVASFRTVRPQPDGRTDAAGVSGGARRSG